jgi:hypothetical protein
MTAFYETTYLNASKTHTTHKIWDPFFKDYWAKFPWRLPLDQDPDPEDATDYARKPVGEAEETTKQRLIEETETVSVYIHEMRIVIDLPLYRK